MELDQYTDAINLINEQEISEQTRVDDNLDSATFSRKKMTYSVEQLDGQKTNEPKDQSGLMALHQAAQENNTDYIQELVSIGCDVNAVDANGGQQTPLHKATMYGHKKSVKLLLENNADANQCDENGYTPIQTAIIYGGDFQIVEMLIEKTNLLKEDNNGQNILHIVVRFHQVDIINLILSHEQVSALISNINKDRFTPFHLAVSLGYLDTVESFLNKLSIDITTTVTNGKHVLHLAAATNNLALMVLLLKIKDASCLINQPDSQLITPLHDAARCGQLNQVTLLLDKGAKVSITSEGYSPLHYACEEGHLSIAKKLLERHPFQKDLSTKRNKSTALHLAALRGHAAIVKFLLDSGVPITHNILQASFLDLAILYKHTAVASEAVKHDRWKECLDLVSPTRSPPIIELIETLPDVALSVMDRSISSQTLPTHPEHHKIYNFKYISMSREVLSESIDTNPSGFFQLIWHYVLCLFTLNDDKSLDVIKAILKSNQAHTFLTHPLPVTYLNLKWRNYGRLYLQIRAIIPTILTIFLTILVVTVEPPRPPNSRETNSTGDDLIEGVPYYITSVVLFIYIVVLIIQGIMLIRLRKVLHRAHYSIEIGTIVSTTIFLFVTPTYWPAGVAALLFAWIGVNLFSRYFDVIGLYTIMFYDLLLRIGKAILVGLYYIIVFGLILYILIGDEYFYNHPVRAIYVTSFFVISGFDISILREKNNNGTLQYETATFIIALTLTVVLTIVLQSLMIGIAVRSIGSIKMDAIATQSELKATLFLEIDPNIPKAIKDKFIPKCYKVKEGKSVSNIIRNIWNYVTLIFVTNVEGEKLSRDT